MKANRIAACLVVSSVLAVMIAFLSAHAQSTTPQSTASHLKLAEEQFKNIQALKGIPADQLIPSMQFISASLGVECEFCHVHGSMDKDDKKPKVTARKMITMMLAINKNYFDGHREVTCNSCHRGAEHPLSIPVVGEDETKSAEKPDEKISTPAAEQLLDKYLAAAGGAEAIQKIGSRVQKGTLTAFGGQHFPVDVFAKAPYKRLSIMHLQTGDSVTAYDGHEGWLAVPGRTHFMSAEENVAARIDADLYFAAHLKTQYQKFRVEPGEKIDGRDTWLVIGRTEGQPPIRLYLDKQSALLLRLVRYAETPLGRNPTQIDYSDYRDANGVKVPFRWSLSRPGNKFTIQVDQMQQNVPVDDAKFQKPATTPEQEPAAH